MIIKKIDNNKLNIKKEFYSMTILSIIAITINIFSHNKYGMYQLGEFLLLSCFIILDILTLTKFIILKVRKKTVYFISYKLELMLKNFSIILGLVAIVILNILGCLI